MVTNGTRVALIILTSVVVLTALTDTAIGKYARGSSKSQRIASDPLNSYRYGLGIAIGAGTYSGFSGMMRLRKNVFLQSQVGFPLIKGVFMVSGDYVLQFPRFFKKLPQLTPYGGAGAMLLSGDNFVSLVSENDEGSVYVGARMPLGAYFLLWPGGYPLQIFGEGVPGLLVIPDIVITLGFSLGVRYLF